MSHTKGPWNWRLDAGTWYLAPGVLITDYTDGTPDGDLIDRGNARLIAAAPDLLEALLLVVARADEAISCLPKGAQASAKSGGGFVFPLDNDTAMVCRAAISKATGAA